MGIGKGIIIIAAVLALFVLLRAQANVDTVMITINVGPNATQEDLEPVLRVLEYTNASATFFVPGSLNLSIPDLHERSCYTNTHVRLAQIQDPASEILDCPGVGFRAPYMDVGNSSYQYIRREFAYDSSVYHRYTWFWENPRGLEQVPITTVLVFPLDSNFMMPFIGDWFFTLAQRSHSDEVVIALHLDDLEEHLLEFEFLIRHYQQEADLMTIGGWLESSSA